MNYTLLEMLYHIPELQDLSYQIYRQMPERISREEHLSKIWQECKAFPDPQLQDLFLRLEDAENFVFALQERAAFFTGLWFGQDLSQTLGG